MSQPDAQSPIWDAAAIVAHRERKDQHFASGKGPVPAAEFTDLHYFAPAPAWAFVLPLLPPPAGLPQEYAFETSNGVTKYLACAGQVEVPLPDGQSHALLAFTPLGEENPRQVFIPFRDKTSGGQTASVQTYGAGRYIDAPLLYTSSGVRVALDFNLAYHPYCAYGDGWSCPLPPAQNTLPVAVLAGEKL